jgi:hypothetical protein
MHLPFEIKSRSHLVRLLFCINCVTLLLVLGALIWSSKQSGSILPVPRQIVYSLPSPLLRFTSQSLRIKADQFYLKGTLSKSEGELEDWMETDSTAADLSP